MLELRRRISGFPAQRPLKAAAPYTAVQGDAGKHKRTMVSLGIMNTQVNVRFPAQLLQQAQRHATAEGFGTVQDFIRESVRERVRGERLTPSEYAELERVLARKHKWLGEDELWKALQHPAHGSRSRADRGARARRQERAAKKI